MRPWVVAFALGLLGWVEGFRLPRAPTSPASSSKSLSSVGLSRTVRPFMCFISATHTEIVQILIVS
jgi:hypothetical protein